MPDRKKIPSNLTTTQKTLATTYQCPSNHIATPSQPPNNHTEDASNHIGIPEQPHRTPKKLDSNILATITPRNYLTTPQKILVTR